MNSAIKAPGCTPEDLLLHTKRNSSCTSGDPLRGGSDLRRKAGYQFQWNEPGDHDQKATSLLHESLTIPIPKLGMRPLIERVLSRWEIRKA